MFLFEQPPGAAPASLSSALLGRCISINGDQPAGIAFARRLTVGDREALLLHLRRQISGEGISCVSQCGQCGEQIDIDLRVSDLLVAPYAHQGLDYDEIFDAAGVRYRVSFRLPNGEDQEQAAAAARSGDEAAVALLLQRCVRSLETADRKPVDPIPAELAGEISRLMAARDPQAELLVDCECPACGAELRLLFDAGQFVLREARIHSGELFREVRALAAHFHWSEADILAMSPRRRRRYVESIEESGAGRRA
jgi:hypothetical protein